MILPRTISKKGFTLIELLVALTIITILAVAVYAALNPAQRLADSKNARRQADIAEILSALNQSVVDSKGTYPTVMAAMGSTEVRQLGTGNAVACPDTTVGTTVATQCTGVTAGCFNLMADDAQDLIPYLASMPIDPAGTAVDADSIETGYAISKDVNGIVTIKACHAEGDAPITVSR